MLESPGNDNIRNLASEMSWDTAYVHSDLSYDGTAKQRKSYKTSKLYQSYGPLLQRWLDTQDFNSGMATGKECLIGVGCEYVETIQMFLKSMGYENTAAILEYRVVLRKVLNFGGTLV